LKLQIKFFLKKVLILSNFICSINSNQTILPDASATVTFSSTTASSNNNLSTYYDDEFDVEAFSTYFGLLDLRDLIIIRPISGDEDDRILQSINPKYIIIYHPDQAFVRRVEVRFLLTEGL
jgi:hypothetical protein